MIFNDFWIHEQRKKEKKMKQQKRQMMTVAEQTEFINRFSAMADVTEFPGCCGINVVCSLDMITSEMNEIRSDRAEDDLDLRPDFEVKFIQAQLLLDRDFESYRLATTNQNQSEIAVGLAAVGFKALAKFKSQTTGNTITIWGYEFPKAPAKRKR